MSVRAYTTLFSRAVAMLLGRSGDHAPQPMGRHFERTAVRGYYNDLTAKVRLAPDVDGGIPYGETRDGRRIYFPIKIAQLALGAYDMWLETGSMAYREKFLDVSNWLVQHQDQRGGWHNPWTYVGDPSLSEYSGMAQGEAVSVLVRAHLLTQDARYLTAAQTAFELLVTNTVDGGCAHVDGDAVFLEEYPEEPPNTVLNGWIFAIFGVRDLALVAGGDRIDQILAATVSTLERTLPVYDTGYWTYYDRRGHIASPFYHSLHISLLDALHQLTGEAVFAEFSARWADYGRRRMNRGRALTLKAWQKLRNPVKARMY